jgi:hypothetical protein
MVRRAAADSVTAAAQMVRTPDCRTRVGIWGFGDLGI